MPFPRFVACLSLALLAACGSRQPDTRLRPDMADVIGFYQNLRPRPTETLTANEARRQPVMADAVRAGWNVLGLPVRTDDVAQVTDLTLQTDTALLPARLYGPARSSTPRPVILFFHGGGWVIGGLDAYDASARALSARTGAAVLSVHYRQAPEYPFPAAHDDAASAYRWLLASARDLGLDPGRIALAGESAGANLALATAVAARDAGATRPVHLLLIYPVAGTSLAGATAADDALPLTRAAAAWYVRQYAPTPDRLADPRLDLVRADLGRLPPTTLILAEIDPLRSGGEVLAQRMAAAGTPVELRTFAGLTHEFFGTATLVADARTAQDYAGQRLGTAFAAAPAAAAPVAPGTRPAAPVRRRVRHRVR